MEINVIVKSSIDYDFKYNGDLSESEVIDIIKTKYRGNLWRALKDNFIADIDSEVVDEILDEQ